jgi:hypothetical protein
MEDVLCFWCLGRVPFGAVLVLLYCNLSLGSLVFLIPRCSNKILMFQKKSLNS